MQETQREIPTEYLPKFKRVFGQTAKRAFRLGMTEPSFDVISKRYVPADNNEIAGQTYRELQTLKFSPVSVDIGDWHVCAKIKTSNLETKLDYTAQTINGMYYTFYEDVPDAELKKSPFACDHCKHEYKRSLYFILRNTKTGKYTQISASCLQDFIKSNKAYDIAMVLNNLDNAINSIADDNKDADEDRELLWYHTDKILPIAVYVYNKYGWVSVQKGKDTEIMSSADIIHAIIDAEKFPQDYDERKCIEESAKIIAFHKDRLAGIKAEEKSENTNEFYSSISECITGNYIEDKVGGFGMLCYAVKVYYDGEDEDVKESEYIGKIDTHIRVKCKMVHKKQVNTRRGPSVLVIMDADGNKIKIFAGANTQAGMDFGKSIVDDMYELEGIVKYFDEYNGVKYTTLSRVTILSKHRPESDVKVVKDASEIYQSIAPTA